MRRRAVVVDEDTGPAAVDGRGRRRAPGRRARRSQCTRSGLRRMAPVDAVVDRRRAGCTGRRGGTRRPSWRQSVGVVEPAGRRDEVEARAVAGRGRLARESHDVGGVAAERGTGGLVAHVMSASSLLLVRLRLVVDVVDLRARRAISPAGARRSAAHPVRPASSFASVARPACSARARRRRRCRTHGQLPCGCRTVATSSLRALDRFVACSVALRGRAPPTGAGACTGASGCVHAASSASPPSTSSPANMTLVRVRDVARRRQVVGDVEHRDAPLVAEAAQQVEHADPHRDVEHRRRLVGEDEPRVRRRARGRWRRAAAGRPTARAGSGRAARGVSPTVAISSTSWPPRSRRGPRLHRGSERALEEVPDAMRRVERAEGVLEDHLDAPSGTAAARAASGRAQHVFAVEDDRLPSEAARGERCSVRSSTCRCRTRRRVRRSRRRARSRSTPADGAHRPCGRTSPPDP